MLREGRPVRGAKFSRRGAKSGQGVAGVDFETEQRKIDQ